MLDLPVRSGVHDGGPIDPCRSKLCCSSQNRMNFLLVNCVPLSVMMEFGTPKRWMIPRKNSTACSELIMGIGRASIHFVNLSTLTSKWV